MERKKITLKMPLSREKTAQLEAIAKQKTETIRKPFVNPNAKTGLKSKKREPKKPISDLGRTVKFLYKKYPKVFIKDRSKPLKCGIEKDIFADLGDKPDATKRMIKKALRHYVFSFQYMKNMATATHRHDLHGTPVEALTDEHKSFAKEWIIEREKEKKETDTKGVSTEDTSKKDVHD